MSSILAPTNPVFAAAPTIKLLTIADVAVLPRTLPSGDVRYELDDGRLIIMPPPGDIHGAVQAKITSKLIIDGQAKGLGKVRSEVGLVLRRNPDRLTCPDAVFISSASLPVQRSSEGYLETIPELVIEIRSPNDTGPEVQSKVNEYLPAVVWVADPARQTITAHRVGIAPKTFGPTDTLAIPDVIPGFQAVVADLFRD